MKRGKTEWVIHLSQTPRRDLRLWRLKQLSLGGERFPTLLLKPKKVPYSLPTPLGSGSKLTFPRQDANGISPVVVGTLKGFHLLISQVLRIVKGPGFLRGKTVNVPLLCQAAGLICMAVAISFWNEQHPPFSYIHADFFLSFSFFLGGGAGGWAGSHV